MISDLRSALYSEIWPWGRCGAHHYEPKPSGWGLEPRFCRIVADVQRNRHFPSYLFLILFVLWHTDQK